MISYRALLFLSLFGRMSAADVSPAIHIDQVGYLPAAPKIAVVATSGAAGFVLRRVSDDSEALTGQLSAPQTDALSGDTVQLADFSAITTQGDYYLDVPGVGRSYAFAIRRDVFAHAFYLTMRGFYGQRCTTAVNMGPDFPTYQHAACHLNGGFHASSGKTGSYVSSGGWHDAGDYGRYVVNAGITTGTLLWAWEIYHARLNGVSLNIPESSNRVPDMLDEIRWELDWLLTMQDQDGGVWHKQTSTSFPGFIMPEADRLHSLVIGTGTSPYKSSCATADFAAVLAIASRVFAASDPSYSATALQAARNAWTWVAAHPNVTFANPAGVSTGEYGDNNCSDERLWAAAELWRTSDESTYGDYFKANYSSFLSSISATNPPGWGSVGALALWTYALANNPDRDVTANNAIRRASITAADAIAARTLASPYRISMQSSDYYWGSNSVAMNYSMQLLIANMFQRDARYTNAAFENLHYILGRNAVSVSWVTQLGSNPIHHPHRRPSAADNNVEPWPGLMSGGPDPNRDDPTMQTVPPAPPMRMWVDDQNAYSVNEIAINWNAPLVFVLAASLPEPPMTLRHRN